MDNRYLPVGVKTIAISVGEEVRTIRDVYELYRLQIGFVKRTLWEGKSRPLQKSI